jgi:hypothetical protein
MLGLIGFAGPAGATGGVPTFSWTGKAEMRSSHVSNWSDGGNWKGGVAPTAPGPVALVFPALNCSSSSSFCGVSNNDITGLTVSQLTIDSAPTINNPGAYNISGDPITLGSLRNNAPPFFISAPSLGLPITLSGSPTWNFDGGFLNLFGSITGSGALTMTMVNEAQPSLFGPLSVGALNIVGKDVNDVGDYAFNNGNLDLQTGSSLDAAVHLVRAALFDTASFPIQSLTTSGGFVWAGLGSPGAGTLPIQGPAAFDTASIAYFPNMAPGTAGVDYDQIQATGAVNLSSVQLELNAACNEPLGTVYTLVTASGGLTGTFRQDLQNGSGNIGNGAILQAQPSTDPSCATGTAPYLQFAYNSTAVTATVVTKP